MHKYLALGGLIICKTPAPYPEGYTQNAYLARNRVWIGSGILLLLMMLDKACVMLLLLPLVLVMMVANWYSS